MVRTSVPRARQTAVSRQDALDQRGAIVGAFGSDGLDFAARVEQEDLCALNAFDFDLLLISRLQRQGRHRLQFVFFGHGASCDRERSPRD